MIWIKKEMPEITTVGKNKWYFDLQRRLGRTEEVVMGSENSFLCWLSRNDQGKRFNKSPKKPKQSLEQAAEREECDVRA